MPHLLVFNGDSTIWRDAFDDTRPTLAAGVGFDVLMDQLVQRFDVLLERRLFHLRSETGGDP